jgi:hypothetical protein
MLDERREAPANEIGSVLPWVGYEKSRKTDEARHSSDGQRKSQALVAQVTEALAHAAVDCP